MAKAAMLDDENQLTQLRIRLVSSHRFLIRATISGYKEVSTTNERR